MSRVKKCLRGLCRVVLSYTFVRVKCIWGLRGITIAMLSALKNARSGILVLGCVKSSSRVPLGATSQKMKFCNIILI